MSFISIFLFLSVGLYVESVWIEPLQNEVKCKSLIDFVMVFDGSDSISAPDFQLLRESVEKLVDQLNIGVGEGRMGIIVYSRLVNMTVNLTHNKMKLKEDARIMPHPRSGTNTALGIAAMLKMFKSSNRDVPKVGIVVTDGISLDPEETAKEATLSKDYGINMFSVGITKKIDHDELNKIASNENQVLMLDSFDELARNIGGLVKLVCPADCGQPPKLPYTIMDPGSTIEGTRRSYKCEANTIMEGNPDIVCSDDGGWSVTDLYCRPDCKEPLPVPNAVIRPGGTLEGAVRTYDCERTTVLEGEPNVFCGNNGQWSKHKFYCRPDCGQPDLVPRATYQVHSTLEGNVTRYKCKPDTVLEGEPTVICQSNGQWSPPDFYCRPNCGKPLNIPRASIPDGPTLEGSTLEYQCHKDTVMEGNPVIVCGQDGKWSDSNLYCRPDCKEPSIVQRATVMPGMTVEGASRQYVCEHGTILEGDPHVICEGSGQWSKSNFYCRPDCGMPDPVPRTTYEVQSTFEGNITRYTCLPNSVLEGEPTIVCQHSGIWSIPEFYCRPDCGIPVPIPRASIAQGSTLEGNSIQYQCDHNTVMEGNPVITCGPDGQWSKNDLYCRPDCGLPIDVPNAAWLSGPSLEGNVTSYVCDITTVMEGNPQVICQRNGEWSKPEFYCRPDCGIPDVVPNAFWQPGPTLEGSTTQFTCVANTVLQGDSSITCGRDGKWSPPSFYCRPDCGIPVDIPNAAWKPSPTLEGDMITYFCASHTVLEGNSTIICGHDGHWSIPTFYCRPDCGIPIDVPNAKWLPGPSLEGSVTSYKCIGNTVMEGDSTSSCGKDGKWSHPNFYCRPDCGIPINVPNAKWDVGSTLEGSTSTYSCIGTSVLEGDASITCGKDGRWTPPTFYCRPDCGQPPPIPRARSGNGPTLEGSLVTYMCDPKTVTEGNPTIICAGDGSWSSTDLYCRPDCGVPINVPRAVTPTGPTVEGSRLVYECQKKTVLEGNSSIICESNGQWTRPLFYCRPDCGIPPDVQNAIMDSGSTLEEASRYYTCKPGTVLEGNAEIRCGSSGQWSKPQFRCKYDCGAPVVIPHAHVDEGLTTEGAIRTYICNNGTIMEGSSTVTCQEDGTWSPISFQCKHDCGEPYMIPNAIVRPGPTVEGSVRQYQCENGTTLEGNPEIRCKNNGKWTLTSIRCRPDCGPPPHVPRTTVSHGATVEGSVATYKCDSHTTMEGNSKIVCKKNGKWSKPSLQCRTDCGEPMSVPYAVLLPGPTTEGMSRYYECSSGCETIGNPEIRCMEDGKWTQIEFYCHVVSHPGPKPPSTLPPVPGPCDFCKMQYGVGFNPHPEDCDKFTQCYFDQNGQVQAVFRQCPFGQYWDQDVLTCRPSEQVQCMHEKCHMPGLLSYPYGNKTSCKAFWKCNLGKSIGMCCPDGYAYDSHQGCVHDPDCKDTCPPLVYHEGACDTRPSWKNPYGYQQFIPGLGWKEMECGSGSKYDCTSCKCEYHESFLPGKVCKPEINIAFDDDCFDDSDHHYEIENHNITLTGGGLAYFNGINSRLVIPHIEKMKHYTDLVVRMRYLDVPDVGLRGLISNGEYDSPSMMIVKSKRNLHYMAKCESNRITSFYLPMSPGNWNDLTFMHDTKRLEGKVNNVRAEKWAFGHIQVLDSALQIGYAPGFQNFHGYVDYVSIYLCRPDD